MKLIEIFVIPPNGLEMRSDRCCFGLSISNNGASVIELIWSAGVEVGDLPGLIEGIVKLLEDECPLRAFGLA